MIIYDSENIFLMCYNVELKNIVIVLVLILLLIEILGYKSIFLKMI